MQPEEFARYKELKVGGPIDPDSEVDKTLIENGYLVPEGMDEIAYVRSIYNKARTDPANWSATICPTIACNFGCDYCFELHRPGKMSQEVQDAIIRALEERAPRLENFGVTWYGGEPTLAWDVIQKLSARFIKICQEHDITYESNMISNGYLLNSEKVDELESLRISSVQITLDGNSEHHDSRRVLLSGKGTFNRIIENLKNFVGQKAYASIRVNVDFRNKDGVHSLIDRLAEAGFGNQPNIGIYFAAVGTTTEPSHGVVQHCLTRKGFAELEPEYFDHAVAVGLSAIPYPETRFSGCMAVRPDEYVIQADGELHKCWDTVGQSQYAVGNILEVDRNSLNASNLQRWFKYDPFSEDIACRTCTWVPTCMGGCPFTVVYAENSPDSQVHLECTTFKYNSKTMLPKYVDYISKGGDTGKLKKVSDK